MVIRAGYECPSTSTTGWLYQAGTRARVRPSSTGYALRVTSVDGFTMSDMDLASRDAEQPGESSVAVFVTSSDNVSFERTRIVAGDGVSGAAGELGGSNHFGMSLDGAGATAATGGIAKICACADGTSFTGASGGLGGVTPTSGGVGQPNHGGGARGEAQTLTEPCTNGGSGAPAPARSDATGAAWSVPSLQHLAGFPGRELTR